MITLLVLTPVFKNMPQNAQGAIIIAAVIGLVKYEEWLYLWKACPALASGEGGSLGRLTAASAAPVEHSGSRSPEPHSSTSSPAALQAVSITCSSFGQKQ